MTGVLNALSCGMASPQLSNLTINAGATSPSNATAELEFNANGLLNTIVDTGSGGVVTSRLPSWHGRGYLITGSGSGYEIRCTVQSGSSPTAGSDAIDTWLSLSSERTWLLFRNSLGLSSGSWLVEIRGAGGSTIASAVYSMTASMSSP